MKKKKLQRKFWQKTIHSRYCVWLSRQGTTNSFSFSETSLISSAAFYSLVNSFGILTLKVYPFRLKSLLSASMSRIWKRKTNFEHSYRFVDISKEYEYFGIQSFKIKMTVIFLLNWNNLACFVINGLKRQCNIYKIHKMRTFQWFVAFSQNYKKESFSRHK